MGTWRVLLLLVSQSSLCSLSPCQHGVLYCRVGSIQSRSRSLRVHKPSLLLCAVPLASHGGVLLSLSFSVRQWRPRT